MAADAPRPATTRKRQAGAALRGLAAELDIAKRGRNADLNRAEFAELCDTVLAACSTPEQRGRAEAARKLYDGDLQAAVPVKLPAVPALPPLPADAPSSSSSVGVKLPVPALPVLSQPPAKRVAAPAATAGHAPFRLRGASCLFTYNSPLFCAVDPETLWAEFLEFIRSMDILTKWTAAMEESLHSQDDSRVHLHVFMEFRKAVDWTTLDPVRFKGSRPDARPTVARGGNQKDVINHGHFYVYAQKEGKLHVDTSGWEPWRDYPVKGWWIDELWTAHKLSHTTYLDYATKVRVGFPGRLRQLQSVQHQERTALLREKQRLVALRLAPLKHDFLPAILARLRPWSEQYKQDEMRYNFLVLRGVSRSGKSTLAKSLGKLLGLGVPYIQTVQSAASADLKGFNNDVHGYIVFDNVNDQEFILSQRALLQANNDVHTLADSKTGIYAYDVWLYQVPIVVTVDMSARWDPHEDWIAANSVEVFLHGPCYKD